MLTFNQADQVSKLPTTSWFGLKIFNREEAFQRAFGKGFDYDWSSESKYFRPENPIARFSNAK